MNKNLKAILFDFDGVILDSMGAKGKAFVELFNDESSQIKIEISNYHFEHGGMTRSIKIKHIVEQIIGKVVSPAEIELLISKFSDIVVDTVCNCQWTPNANETLIELNKIVDQYIVTATPTEEIKIILDNIGIIKLFKDIYGYPPLKSDLLLNLIKENDLNNNDVIFVGDSMSDYEAAKRANIPFIGFSAKESIFPNSVRCIKEISEIIGIIAV